MILANKIWGEGEEAVIFLHGMMGNGRNFASVARELSNNVLKMTSFKLVLMDLRNHGESGHSEIMDFDSMVQDVIDTVDDMGIEKFHLVGHSLGGKVAMKLACDFSQRIKSLVVVDIVPKDYQPHFEQEMSELVNLDLKTLKSRKQAENFLEDKIEDWPLRMFLLSSLREKAGEWGWGNNVEVLYKNLAKLSLNPLKIGSSFSGEVLFLIGEFSEFWQRDDENLCRNYFPNVTWQVVAGSGHNIHMEKREEFCRQIAEFITSAGK